MKEALTKVRSARLRLITVTPELILELLKVPEGGIRVGTRVIAAIENAIPASAKALRCSIGDAGRVQLVIEDQSFDEVIEGTKIPDLIPVYSETIP
jgi:hypothetical protein